MRATAPWPNARISRLRIRKTITIGLGQIAGNTKDSPCCGTVCAGRGSNMPQIWMTYVELGSLLQCSPNEAREQARAVYADRKKSRDGQSRVKLNAGWMELFINQVRGDDRFDRAARELRT